MCIGGGKERGFTFFTRSAPTAGSGTLWRNIVIVAAFPSCVTLWESTGACNGTLTKCIP